MRISDRDIVERRALVGETKADDPEMCPVGPEILDIEISVNGCPNNCEFCYKENNNGPATNMTLGEFKEILDKFPKTLTQVAFGITGTQTNPDFIGMMKYCREKGIIPNFTLSGIDATDEFIEESSKLIGAVAVSAYKTDKNVCYNTVRKYIDQGITQTNIHLLVSAQTIEFVYEVLDDYKNNPKLKGMNAIVFLGVKPKGRAKGKFDSITQNEYMALVDHCLREGISFGFDSCSAPKYEKAVKALNIRSPTIEI